MRDQVLSNVVEMETSGYQLFDLEDIEFRCATPVLNVDTVFPPNIYTPVSPSLSNGSEMGSVVKNPILSDNEEDRENSPTTCSVLERPNDPPNALRNSPFERDLKIFLIRFYKGLFE